MATSNETTNLSHPHCTGTNCDYAIDKTTGEGLCFSGSGTCIECHLLEAEESPLHDQSLIDATRQINQILTAIPADPKGRQLSFLVTGSGLLLAWVNHGGELPADAVTGQDEAAVVAQALKLKI